MYVCMHAYMHVCMYVCAYVCMYVCMHVCMHLCMHVRMHACTDVRLLLCMYVCMYASMSSSVYTCTYVCMYACMHVCVCDCAYTCANARLQCMCVSVLRPKGQLAEIRTFIQHAFCLVTQMGFAPVRAQRFKFLSRAGSVRILDKG